MEKMICRKWFYCYWMSLFFEDFSRWLNLTGQICPPAEAEPAGRLPGPEAGRLQQEYQDLFQGTDARVYIPVWASAAKNNGSILMDPTTLEVIKTYKKWGYEPVNMDGNPPDYIGQMYRFCAYLYAALLGAEEQSAGWQNIREAVVGFENQFMLDTVKAAADGIKEYAEAGLFVKLAEEMLVFYDDTAEVSWTSQQQQSAAACLRQSPFFDVFQNGCRPPLPVAGKRIVRTTGRNNCGGKCVILAAEQEGCVLEISTDDSENHPQVRACIRGRGYRKTYLDGRRLRFPMKRIGARGEGRFKRISWAEAADIVAGELKRTRCEYGVASRYINYSTGVTSVLRPDAMVKRLLSLDGGYLDKYNTYSDACSKYTLPYIYGNTISSSSTEDILNTRLLVFWGHNPAETIFGALLNPQLSQLKEKGIRVIVVDPRCSNTAVTYADEWIGLKPSTDSALADAMAYVIWSEGLQDQTFMDRYCLGFDEAHMPAGIEPGQSYEAYLFGKKDGIPKTPRWAAAVTGVPADKITAFAREYATTKPACLLSGLGPQRTGNGEQTTRSLAMLACLTGNVGKSGGSSGVHGNIGGPVAPAFPVLKNPYPGKIPSFLWTRAIEHGTGMTREQDGLKGVDRLPSNIRLIVNLAGNTLVNQHSDINNTIRILKDPAKCEFILCSDVFMTPSARFADVLLPASSFLEEENIVPPWGGFGDYLLYQNRALRPLFESDFEYGFLAAVAERLGIAGRFTDGCGDYREWLSRLYEETRKKEPELPAFEDFKREGGYHYQNRRPSIAYEQQIRDFEHHPFDTPSGKIEIFSRQIFALNKPEEIPAIPCYVPCPDGPQDKRAGQFPLQLIGWHSMSRCHSIHGHNEWAVEADPHRLWINPSDARRRGVEDGELVEVFNQRGKTQIKARITERIVKGVVAMAQGSWYTPDASGTDRSGSINVLTSTTPTPLARGNSQHSILVEVAPLLIKNTKSE